MQLLIINQSVIPVPRKYLAKAFVFFKKELIKKKILSTKNRNELTLVFLNKAPAKKLNEQFRKKNYATDVLSFESDDPESYGELVFCSQIIKKQSKEHELSFRDECVYMALHGFLHLLGFEHEDNVEKAKVMFKLQDGLFAKFLNQ